MEQIIAQLFAARDNAHRLHLSTRSFAAHLALGDLYEALLDAADSLAEIYQGKYGIMNIEPLTSYNESTNAISFVTHLAAWAEEARKDFKPTDTNLLNEWDNVISFIYKAKYKLENLK